MQSAQYKYEVGMQDFVNKPCHIVVGICFAKNCKKRIESGFIIRF